MNIQIKIAIQNAIAQKMWSMFQDISCQLKTAWQLARLGSGDLLSTEYIQQWTSVLG
jgi:hypothetical protein